jgi:hypothetical protein
MRNGLGRAGMFLVSFHPARRFPAKPRGGNVSFDPKAEIDRLPATIFRIM